jgi:hypothetical protein
VGAKRTVKLAEAPAPRLKVGFPTTVKSEHESLRVPDSVPPPEFVTVKVVSRWVPVVTLPKAREAVLRAHAGSDVGAVGATEDFLEQLQRINTADARADTMSWRRMGAPLEPGSE